MSRSRQFFQGVGSSWLATFATVLYSLLSVPIALRHLSVDEFGLFVLLLQVAAYFSLVEIGMSAATSRILVDYKDRPEDGRYGSVIITGFLVFSVQALIVLCVGIPASSLIIRLIRVPSELAEVGVLLLRWLAITSALAMAFRITGAVLYANKRLDLINIFIGLNMLVGLVLLAAILAAQKGLVGLVWVFLAQTLIAITLPTIACYKLGLFPATGSWGRPSMERFRELFKFGKDIFLVNVGNQVLEASQLIIVTRTMGLTAAAIWSVNTKLFALVYQLVTKVEGTAIVFFAEMMVRGEADRLSVRFRQIYQLTAGISVIALTVVVCINRAFVSVWASPSLAWELQFSILMSVMVLLNALTRCSSDLIVHTKKIAAFRYIYFLEAVVFVALALWLSAKFGLYGVLGAAILSLVVFRATYTTWRMADYFTLSQWVFWWSWLKRPLLSGLGVLPFGLSGAWLVDYLPSVWAKLLVATLWIGLPGAMVLYFVSLPRDVKDELFRRLPRPAAAG